MPHGHGLRRRGWLAAAAGAVAVGSAVVLGELLAGLVSPSLSPLTAVGGAVIDAVPPGVKDWAVALFGTADKVALLVGMALVMVVLAALAGAVEDRRRFMGVVVVALFGLVGLTAVLTRAQASFNAIALAVLTAAAAAALLRFLIRRLQDRGSAPGAGADAAPGRRRFLQVLAGGAAFTVIGGALAATWRGAAAAVSEARSRVVLPAPGSPAPAIPAAAEAKVDGMQPLVTPNPEFYRIDTALTVPAINPDTWVLRVTGMVDREVELTFAELLAKPLTERHVTIACVSNNVGGDLIGNARWLGWPVRELLALAGPQPGADMVLSRSVDGWTAGTPLEVLTDSRDALLAVGMNGEPLPLEHGFPVRLVVPGLYGYVSATKWVTGLKVTRFADDVAYWTPRGWSERGPIKTSSRIDVPRTGRQVKAGTVVFGGIAWAQHTGIGKVELRMNRGPWQQAQLAAGISLDTWYQWKLGMDLTAGQYEVQVRATDLAAQVQEEQSKPVAPDGATGFHTIRVDVQP
ncbi:molybdopterin-dependent oxidoreductase [Pseudarthrobacter sp. NPDC058329]|uniref:molybdopterin-dependent oxidoreductase n=1 Tax=Pseudarthrobacter sp. NPDC058329 TaxID=3346448 RepID=UPI0036D8BA82